MVTMKQLSKIGLAVAIALLLCLLPMPYGFYTLIRFIAMVFFGCLAFAFNKENKTSLAIMAGAVALLFQPFFKIVLGRGMWSVVDVIVAVTLLILWYKHK